MIIGDKVRVKKDYNVSLSFGNVGIRISEGATGVVLQTEDKTSVASIGFKLNDSITVTALVDRDIFDIVS